MALRRRLLQDIADLQNNPYPNIVLCMQDDLKTACLLLTPNDKAPLHCTVIFGEDYPLNLPRITIESQIEHPNVFGNYICASILNTTEGYTPAYTLKSIAIQMLSFFSSDRIEQEGGRYSVDLRDYRQEYANPRYAQYNGEYVCAKCGFGGRNILRPCAGPQLPVLNPSRQRPPVVSKRSEKAQNVVAISNADAVDIDRQERDSDRRPRLIERILALPDELLLLILGELDTKDLLAAAKACSRISEFMNSYDAIRMRELQCFCFKESFMQTKLGVGVHVSSGRRKAFLESEFDLLSQKAFQEFGVRRSIQGLPFEHWLPLPLSWRHWRSVSADVDSALAGLAIAANIPKESGLNIQVIYSFMNYVVVKLSREAENRWCDRKSTLTHASEKAVESYFGVFHLLCLAAEQDQIVRDANRRVQRFLAGNTSKQAVPDLGQLLVAVLVSDKGLTQELTLAIIKEAILRNVVWMLDARGAGMAELSYLEPSASSDYRLQRTFEASKTSYRLLMFLALFCKTARPAGRAISAIRDDLFDTHGAPPRETVERMAAEIRKIRTVNSFPVFFEAMGLVETPSKENFCSFLKRTIEESVKMGYSCQPITQKEALAIRKIRDPSVEQAADVVPSKRIPQRAGLSFFPGEQGRGRR
ncbi:MAG: hypothetical protein Q9201_002254 [Fulgogasparrea decipioides]